MRRPTALTLSVALLCAALTVVISANPLVRLAYREPDLRLVLETAMAVVALGAGYLVVGRFRQTKLMSDLLLIFPLALLAFTTSSSLPFHVRSARITSPSRRCWRDR